MPDYDKAGDAWEMAVVRCFQRALLRAEIPGRVLRGRHDAHRPDDLDMQVDVVVLSSNPRYRLVLECKHVKGTFLAWGDFRVGGPRDQLRLLPRYCQDTGCRGYVAICFVTSRGPREEVKRDYEGYLVSLDDVLHLYESGEYWVTREFCRKNAIPMIVQPSRRWMVDVDIRRI